MEKTIKNPKVSVKDAIKNGVRPKKMTTKPVESSTETPVEKAIKAVKKGKLKSEPENKIEDTVAALPESKQRSYIKASIVGEVRTVNVDIKDITATSQTVYVADIHAQNVDILATVYWAIMPNTVNVVLRLTKEDYDALLKKKQSHPIKHLYSVVDNAVFPSITYGSWKLDDINGFPTLDQIDEYDAKFRAMDVNIHNPPAIASLKDAEDDFDIDFTEDDEDEFDFEEED